MPIECSPPCSQELPQENFPEVVLLAAFGVRKCHGCKREILNKIVTPQRFGLPHAGSSIMDIKGTNRMAKTLWKCLFSLDNIMCSVS